MDTTDPEENATATTQPPLLTADGGAIAKQPQQATSQNQQNIEANHQQEQSQIDPVEEQQIPLEEANDDNLYRMPGVIALERIEENNLPKQEDKELFHAPVIAITQDKFVNIHNKTRRAYQDLT